MPGGIYPVNIVRISYSACTNDFLSGCNYFLTNIYAMNAGLSFWIVLLVLIAIMWYCDRKFNMLRDASTATPKPYSYARVQLAWWTVLIFSAMISILLLKGQLPTLDNSMLVILGISAGTTTVARLIDQSDQQKSVGPLSQDSKGQNFLLDLLSDNTGVNIHRLQTLILISTSSGVAFAYSTNTSKYRSASKIPVSRSSYSISPRLRRLLVSIRSR